MTINSKQMDNQFKTIQKQLQTLKKLQQNFEAQNEHQVERQSQNSQKGRILQQFRNQVGNTAQKYGTSRYMAPEQVFGYNQMDSNSNVFEVDPNRCDVYFIGITFLEEKLAKNANPYNPSTTNPKLKKLSKSEIQIFANNKNIDEIYRDLFKERLGKALKESQWEVEFMSRFFRQKVEERFNLEEILVELESWFEKNKVRKEDQMFAEYEREHVKEISKQKKGRKELEISFKQNFEQQQFDACLRDIESFLTECGRDYKHFKNLELAVTKGQNKPELSGNRKD